MKNTLMEEKRPSVFMQMHNGTRTGEGSFNVALQEIFYKAANDNRRKLVAAFPEFFGEEVPEFGIHKQEKPETPAPTAKDRLVALGALLQEIGRDDDAALFVSAKTRAGHLKVAMGDEADIATVLGIAMHMIPAFHKIVSIALDTYQNGPQPPKGLFHIHDTQ